MTWTKLWMIAYRGLTRNRRRTFFTMLAVALGLALLITLNGYIAGVMEDGLQNSIRLQTGHVQVRAASYPEGKHSVQWKDLVERPEEVAARAMALPEVRAAAPILWLDAVLSTGDESIGLQVYGIDVASPLHDPLRASVIAGAFLDANDRSGVLMGGRLAQSLNLKVGDTVHLVTINANGEPVEAPFVIRGLFSSGVLVYDESVLFMPLARAQSFALTGNRASTVMIELHHREDAGKVAAGLAQPGLQALTWRDLNAFIIQSMDAAFSFYILMDAIVIMIVAVIIANTLLMAVFERVREIGILAALGMKRREILQMVLYEAALIALAGVVVGVALGLLGVFFLTQNGFVLGEMATTAGNLPMSNVIYARFAPDLFTWLAVWTFLIALLASLYPAWFAARLEPVRALHTE
ncbi:ABC transporter permease [Caldilinea sp.]|jgi:ABC-type lipoprotein release transport system permease subunit|uniref:ABC transporter permease n=1 Tax=Caldilinea sp. TaxID=2293560 RepID=UPI0021DC85CE|nr:FtsX-like permease family protein [Caldilinea sp.]GIV69144.1 MAG: LolC/E family lipoprotein releasing system, protein [Caldilinea sp.]